MRATLLAGLALTLAACGGGADTAANDSNALMADNMMMDGNLMLDPNASVGGTLPGDANAAGNSAVQNLMEADAATNDADTNLANGL